MARIVFNIDEESKEFVLKGETEDLFADRRIKFYLTNTLKAIFHDDRTITIKYTEEDREYFLKSIQDAFNKYGIEQVASPEIKKVLDDYYKEKENFELFSEKAREIWENKVNIQEFQSFKESLEKNLPTRRLYPKQLLAAFHLTFSQNACNFSVPGSGKTSIVYAAYAYLKNLPPNHPKYINKILVIGPLSSFGPWEDEYKQCFGHILKSKRLSGGVSPIERERYLLSIDPISQIADVTLMSYQSVPNNLENLRYFLKRKDLKVMVVLDEAHRIKNPDGGVWATSALSIAEHCSSRVVLTGTPVPNGYEDIYNLYEFIWPNKDIINFNIHQLREMSEKQFDSRVANLIQNIAPFFIRIRKQDLGLPPIKEEAPVYVKMGNVQREIYDFIENKYIGYFEKNESIKHISSELVKARFIRLMQASTNPALLRQPLEAYFRNQQLDNELYIDDSEIIEKIIRYKDLEGVTKKFEMIKDLVIKILQGNEKVIIWGVFIQNIKELKEYLINHGISSETLIGEVPIETEELAEDIQTREKIIREFHSPDSRFKVIIANPFAVAESISLHKACHHAIYFERTFNAANFIQSKDRIHRVGLPPNTITHYHYLLSENSIDETIHRRLLEKERRMSELIESQEIPLINQNMNYDFDFQDDLKAIIRDYVRRTVKT
jgi:hypothetical protein